MLIWPAELSCHRVEFTRLPWMAELGALAKADFFLELIMMTASQSPQPLTGDSEGECATPAVGVNR